MKYVNLLNKILNVNKKFFIILLLFSIVFDKYIPISTSYSITYLLLISFGLLLVSYPIKLSSSTLNHEKYYLMGYTGIIVSLITLLYFFLFPFKYVPATDDTQVLGKAIMFLILCFISLLIGCINCLLASYAKNSNLKGTVFFTITLILICIFLIVLTFFYTPLVKILSIVLLFSLLIIINVITKVKDK